MPVTDFKPSKKQWLAWQLLHDDHTEFIGYGGSVFSGKSYLLCYWITLNALKYSDTGWGIGRRELLNLKRTTLKTLFKVFNEIGLTPDKYIYNGQENRITFKNKSEIFLIDTAHRPSDPDFTRFGGFELTSCAVDESAETQLKAIEILSTRIGRRNNDKHNLKEKFLETFNPSKGHIYNRYYKKWRDNTLPDTYAFIKALPHDNPSPEVEPYIERLLRTADKVTIERLVHGNFEYDDDPAKLINYDSIIDLFSNTQVEPGANYITADIARLGSDKAVIMAWSGLRVLAIKEFDKSLLTDIDSCIKTFKQTYKVANKNIIVDQDGMGAGLVDYMKVRGFQNGGRPLKGNFLNLKSECYYKLAEVINAGNIYIGTTTTEQKESIISELEAVKSYKIDSDGKLRILPKDKVKELIGRSPDYSDTLMMRMYFELIPKKVTYAKSY